MPQHWLYDEMQTFTLEISSCGSGETPASSEGVLLGGAQSQAHMACCVPGHLRQLLHK